MNDLETLREKYYFPLISIILEDAGVSKTKIQLYEHTGALSRESTMAAICALLIRKHVRKTISDKQMSGSLAKSYASYFYRKEIYELSPLELFDRLTKD